MEAYHSWGCLRACMLGCTPAAQTAQHSWPPSSLTGHRPACQHASMPRPRCRHAGVHPSSTDSPAFLPPFLAGWPSIISSLDDGWPSTSMPACYHLVAGMLGCTLAAQTDQHSCPPFLADWSSTSMPACQHASMPRPRCWHAGVHPSSTDRPAFLAPLPRWLAINQHASMPACYSWGCRRAGMLGCMPAPACRLFEGAPADAGLVAIARSAAAERRLIGSRNLLIQSL